MQDSVSLVHTDLLGDDVVGGQSKDCSLLMDRNQQKVDDGREDKAVGGRSGGGVVGDKVQMVVARNSLREGLTDDGKEARTAGRSGHSRGLVRSLSKEDNQKTLCHILGNRLVVLLFSGEVRTILHLLAGSVVERKRRTTSGKEAQRKVEEDHESNEEDDETQMEDNEKKRKKVVRDSCNIHCHFHLLLHLCDGNLMSEDLRDQGMKLRGCCTLRADDGRCLCCCCCVLLRYGDEKKVEG